MTLVLMYLFFLLLPPLGYLCGIIFRPSKKKTEEQTEEFYKLTPQIERSKKICEFLGLARKYYLIYKVNGEDPKIAILALESMRKNYSEEAPK